MYAQQVLSQPSDTCDSLNPEYCNTDSQHHNSLFCEAGLECSARPFIGRPGNATHGPTYPAMSTTTYESLLDRLKARLAAKVASGSQPLIVHVGANILHEEELTLYRELMPWQPTMVMVEPNTALHHQLKENLKKLGASKASVISAALCDKDASGLTMHAFSDKRFQGNITCVQPDALERMSDWGSLDKEVALLPLERLRWASSCSDSEWEAMKQYLEETPVKCMSVTSLLEEVHAAPGSVDMLTVDAEGFDLEVLDQFVSQTDFHPAWLQFEWNLVDDLTLVWTRLANLAKRGFQLHQHRHDILASADW